MNFFEDFQVTAFDIVNHTFGYTATWTPSEGGDEQTAIVLYSDATDKHGFSNVDYNIERYVMEYKDGDLPGLKDAVTRGFDESVQIHVKDDVTLQCLVRRIETKYDGKTIKAILNPPIYL